MTVTTTEVMVDLKRPPIAKLAPGQGNYVRLRLGPEVCIAVGAQVKKPGQAMVAEPAELMMVHRAAGEMGPYERLLGDAMAGDTALFARQDAVEVAWEIVEPVLGNVTPALEYDPGKLGTGGGRSAGHRRGRLGQSYDVRAASPRVSSSALQILELPHSIMTSPHTSQ